MEIFNIGVYNKNENDFFNVLIQNNIDAFIDVRQRRGVRGSKYSFVNSKKLQEKLEKIGIKYEHISQLAPSNQIREIQKNKDKLEKELKTKRNKLDDSFIFLYSNEILNNFDLREMIEDFKSKKYKKIVFFCVEEKASACHRSLITEKIKMDFKLETKDL